jgi:hypothetical protein
MCVKESRTDPQVTVSLLGLLDGCDATPLHQDIRMTGLEFLTKKGEA